MQPISHHNLSHAWCSRKNAGLGDIVVETDKNAYSVGETVIVKVRLLPDVYCLCLEYEWAVRIVSVETGRVIREWGERQGAASRATGRER